MPTPEQIIAEARSWDKTPYRHQGRLKGHGVDCAGVVNMTGAVLGCVSWEDALRTSYGAEPDPAKMKAALDRLYIRIPKSDMRPADIPWMRAKEKAQHIGIISERNTLIHAVQNYDVQELPIDKMVECRIVAVYRFRGIEAATRMDNGKWIMDNAKNPDPAILNSPLSIINYQEAAS